MKFNKLYILTLLFPAFMGCSDQLDRDIVTELDKDKIIHSYDDVKNLVTGVYLSLPSGFDEIDGAMMASASDEAEHALQSSAVHKYNLGSWNEYDNPDGKWYDYYRAINKANHVLLYADSIRLDYYRLNPEPDQQEIYKSRMSEINRWTYEVRFLRAFFYFELIKRYGGVPIVTGEFNLSSNFKDIGRNTLEDCIDFVVAECDSAALVLPASYDDNDLGRVTKGAALALKSRVLLTAASELFNNTSWTDSYAHPELISLPRGNRDERWKAAADAAKAVIDLTAARYALNRDYEALFKTFDNRELILVRRHGATNTFEKMNYPIGYDKGSCGTGPSQDLVDAYEVKNEDGSSEPFDWNNPKHAQNPYANRDPRLAATILVNGANFKSRPVEAWVGGLDGIGKLGASRTGYYLNKYVDANIDLLTNTKSTHSWILIRLPEMYLNYAEALNEYSPGHADIAKYVNMVRNRRSVAMPKIQADLSQDEMRAKIQNERRVEFAFEGHRIWDLKRWMLAKQYLQKPLRGIRITKTDETFSYTPFVVEQRIFEPKMYLYPIPQSELTKASSLLQNPGWQR